MNAPDRIGIVGTGLIGAALAALVARRAPNVAIEAVEPQGAYRETVAAQMPRITWRHCAEDLAPCDMVFLCCPPNAVQPLAREVLAAGEGLVIDAGSVKGRIVEGLSDAPRFIGGHPLAGGNRPGPFRAEPDALVAARFVLTPHAGNAESEIERVESFLARLGFSVVRLNAAAHDQIVARTSHLPHLLSYAYAGLLSEMDPDELGIFASRSTRTMSRHAAQNTRMWGEILEQNGPAVSAALDELILELMTLRNAFAGRGDSVAKRLEPAAQTAAILNGSNDE
ncbi:prephenate dehydrogenase [Palleronia sp.]|uniref:prephenate dehydrogenase n=1 Tax=Palleronia sp. TaxID=1940284 RepID=UPI0035C85108